MPAIGRVIFKGQSGREYRFRVFPLGTRFRKLSGVFVIAHRARGDNGSLRHAPVFVGNTEDFSQPNAGAKHDFTQHGANCICVQSDDGAESRLKTERDLVAALSQPLAGPTLHLKIRNRNRPFRQKGPTQ